uniref:Putative homing endonuclease n=1 Tax=viral metagenome TaxID=1070528 RepID=A0A6M3M6X3_9ZZZZ
MKEIPLTQGQVALVDDEDFEKVNQYKWCACWYHKPETFYAKRGLDKDDGTRTTQFMHRFILNTPRGKQVDHRNHNGLDNTKGNIRVVTNSQNSLNARKRKGSSSQYKGVHKQNQRWYARISHGNNSDCRYDHIGMFYTELEAALAWDERARNDRSYYRLCNFPIPSGAV